MPATELSCAILFADVAGSTRLYEKLGDRVARRLIGDALTHMTNLIQNQQGEIVKTIGDEIMCRFASARQAAIAALEIQESFYCQQRPGQENISVRIGYHYGPVILQEDGDLFGDAVNIAARVTQIARAGQILTTREGTEGFSAALSAMTRRFDIAALKGKAQAQEIFEIVWEQDADVTHVATAAFASIDASHAMPVLELKLGNQTRHMEAGQSWRIGRDIQCDLVVAAPLASRRHALLGFQRGKFIITDQSTNGTYIQTANGERLYLRRESFPLAGSGIISLGNEIDGNADDTGLLYYQAINQG